jgi:hypothetical protein
MHKRLARLEIEERQGFAAFLRCLSSADSRTWQIGVLEALAVHGVIPPPPADLWDRPQPEKDAYLLMLRERIGGRPREVEAVLRERWHAWEQEHPIRGRRR